MVEMGNGMNITLLIGTCDAYSMLWNNFVTLTDRYWDVDCRKLFVPEHKKAEYPGYETHSPGIMSWSSRILSALDTVETEYTFFVLEDYYFTELLNEEEISIHINFLKNVSGNKIMLDYKCRGLTLVDSMQYQNREVLRLSEYSDYLTSIQPSVWRTRHLKEVMHKDWSPWDFEIKGSNMLKGHEQDTYLMVREQKPYWNAVRRGLKISPGWEDIKQKEQLEDMNLNGQ